MEERQVKPMSRREAVRWIAGALPVVVFPQAGDEASVDQDSLIGRLAYPSMAGQPRESVTDFHNDPFVVGVEKQLRCTCGCNLDVYTCRTTDFTCQVSPAMHRQVVELTKQELSAQEIIDRFVAEHGQIVLMAPPKEGFNLAGYFVPGVLIALVASVMGWVLVRRARLAPDRAPSSAPEAPVTPSDRDASRLEAELSNLDA